MILISFISLHIHGPFNVEEFLKEVICSLNYFYFYLVAHATKQSLSLEKYFSFIVFYYLYFLGFFFLFDLGVTITNRVFYFVFQKTI